MRTSKLAFSLAVASLCLGAAGHGQAAPEPTRLEVALRTSGQFVTAPGSEAPGFDVELLDRFIAWYRVKEKRELRLTTHRVETVPELLQAMQAAHFQIGLGGITITQERQRLVDFSAPYLPVRSVLVARRGVLAPDSGRHQLAGKRVAAITGSTNALLVQELAREVAGMRPELAYGTNEELFAALTGAAPALDAAVVDLTHFWTLGRDADVVLVDYLGAAQGLGFVLPKGSPLGPSLDSFLAEFKGSSSYFHLIRRYFGQDAEEMVRMARD
jgi:ABC-type amino acid transport substrate-binding protein